MRAFHGLPWVFPATTIIRFTSEDLDRLDSCPSANSYWRNLNGVIRRIEREDCDG
jgi:hypothetical protein